MSLITPDSGLIIWMTLIFAVVFFILAKAGFPIITKAVSKRSDYIGKSLKEAKDAHNQLLAIAEEQMKLIDEARQEQSRILNEAADARDKIIAEAKEQARNETSAMIDKAREQIELEKESAMREVRREIASLSVSVAEKLVRHDLCDEARQEALIDALINEAQKSGEAERLN